MDVSFTFTVDLLLVPQSQHNGLNHGPIIFWEYGLVVL